MAGIKSKYGNDYNTPISEYVLTDKAEIADLPTTTSDAKGKFANDVNFKNRPAIGSIAQVIDSNSLTVYMLSNSGWVEI
jgi:hypothetical protein